MSRLTPDSMVRRDLGTMLKSLWKRGPWRGGWAALVFAVAVSLPGCSGVSEVIGLESDPPDEFQVVVRAPLSMPEDYGLRAPKPGAQGPNEQPLRDRTRQIVLDSEGKGKVARKAPARIAGVDATEAALLRKLGADRVDPDIRQVVERETTALELEGKSFVEDLMFWKEPPPPGEAVDAAKERRRLQENAALGRPAEAGDTPKIERKKRGGLLEGVFF